MAPPKSTEISATELEIKRRGRRRLIGAITLGLLAVVFLPMLFDSEPKRDKEMAQEISIQLPAKEGLAPLPAPTAAPAPASAEAVPAKPAEAAPAPTPAPAPAATVAPAKVVESKPEPAKKAAEVVVPPKAEAAKPSSSPSKSEVKSTKAAELKHGFVVQIGAFKDAENAQQTAARMKEAKLPVFTDTVATKTGTVTRVRIGPFAQKSQADSALVKVKLAGADGKIIPLP